MRRWLIVVTLLIIGAVLIAGYFISDLLLFRGSLTSVLRANLYGNSLSNVDIFPDAKLLRGVFLGFEKSSEKIGGYEFINKAVFAGIDNNSNLFFYKVPLVLKADEHNYYRSAQYWDNQWKDLDGYNVVLEDWREMKPGKMYAFRISSDVDKYFPQYDGGNAAFFESKTLEQVYLITKQYVERHKSDLETVYGEVTSSWGVYDIIEMSRGVIDDASSIRVPYLIGVRYLTSLPNGKNI